MCTNLVLSADLLASFNDTHWEKLFYSIQYMNGWLAASDVFDMFPISINPLMPGGNKKKSSRILKQKLHVC